MLLLFPKIKGNVILKESFLLPAIILDRKRIPTE